MQDVEEASGRHNESRRRNHQDEPTTTVLVAPPKTAPLTGGLVLPLTNAVTSPKSAIDDPLLIHPILIKIPLHVRFGVNGLISNLVFMFAYNYSVATFETDTLPAPTIYAIVYFIFIPISHLMVSLLVFGWPDKYFKSLVSNFPVGLTALALGGLLTAYLDSIEFNSRVANYIMDNFQFHQMPARTREMEHQRGEFYSSIVVLFATSVWTYALSVYINSPPSKTKTN